MRHPEPSHALQRFTMTSGRSLDMVSLPHAIAVQVHVLNWAPSEWLCCFPSVVPYEASLFVPWPLLLPPSFRQWKAQKCPFLTP